jgi:hypothetical protein
LWVVGWECSGGGESADPLVGTMRRWRGAFTSNFKLRHMKLLIADICMHCSYAIARCKSSQPSPLEEISFQSISCLVSPLHGEYSQLAASSLREIAALKRNKVGVRQLSKPCELRRTETAAELHLWQISSWSRGNDSFTCFACEPRTRNHRLLTESMVVQIGSCQSR